MDSIGKWKKIVNRLIVKFKFILGIILKWKKWNIGENTIDNYEVKKK